MKCTISHVFTFLRLLLVLASGIFYIHLQINQLNISKLKQRNALFRNSNCIGIRQCLSFSGELFKCRTRHVTYIPQFPCHLIIEQKNTKLQTLEPAHDFRHIEFLKSVRECVNIMFDIENPFMNSRITDKHVLHKTMKIICIVFTLVHN